MSVTVGLRRELHLGVDPRLLYEAIEGPVLPAGTLPLASAGITRAQLNRVQFFS